MLCFFGIITEVIVKRCFTAGWLTQKDIAIEARKELLSSG